MEKVEMIKKIQKERAELYAQKNALYGDSFGQLFEKYGPISALTRMQDKMNRLENMILRGNGDKGDESLVDTLNDLANYCDMTLVELSKSSPKEPPKKKSRKKKAAKKPNAKKKAPKKEEKLQESEDLQYPFLDELSKEVLLNIAKSLDLKVNARASKKVLAAIIEKEFITEEDLRDYISNFTNPPEVEEASGEEV